MNYKINSYVNYLLDNSPSPFCDYIISKEILNLDDKTVRDSYDWAKRFKLYSEIADEQFPDGSWGGFVDALSRTNANKRKYKATARAVWRLRDLSLDENDEMTAKTIDYCRKVLMGEIKTICMKESSNIEQNWVIRNAVSLALFDLAPDDPLVADIKYDRGIVTDNQMAVLRHRLANGPFGLNMTEPYDITENAVDVTFLHGLEDLKSYALFGELMSEKLAPFFYSLCERLVDPNDQIPIKINNYWGPLGKYSESWNKYELKKKDLLLRIIRILNGDSRKKS